MKYEGMKPGVFLDRPNRFIAHVELDGVTVVCHVKNTGRCRELLVPGVPVFIQRAVAPGRKTAWDLISVRKGGRLINIDSAAPNRVFAEWLKTGALLPVPELIRPECRHGDSRFDFYLEFGGKPVFAEVKGVTLEEDGIVRFPDAPTLRGTKHLRGLADCVREGYGAMAVFLIQMRGVRYLEPNRATDPAFADALRAARDAGVHLLALDCDVTEDSLTARDAVELRC